MSKLKLERYGVQELSSEELKSIVGGSWLNRAWGNIKNWFSDTFGGGGSWSDACPCLMDRNTADFMNVPY